MPTNQQFKKRQRQRQVSNALAYLTGTRFFSLAVLGILLGVMTLGEWLPDVPFALMDPDNRAEGLLKLIGSLMIIATFAWLWNTKIDVRPEYTIRELPAKPTRLLAVLLSSPNKEFDVAALQQHLADKTLSLEFFDKPFNNWKMPLKAIGAHKEKLEQIFVVTSNGDGGSSETFDLFRQMVVDLHPGIEVSELEAGGTNFLDMKEIFNLLDKKLDYPGDELTIDLTGGHKLTSIAAAMLTFVEGRAFQYVNNESYKVHLYDIEPVEK